MHPRLETNVLRFQRPADALIEQVTREVTGHPPHVCPGDHWTARAGLVLVGWVIGWACGALI